MSAQFFSLHQYYSSFVNVIFPVLRAKRDVDITKSNYSFPNYKYYLRFLKSKLLRSNHKWRRKLKYQKIHITNSTQPVLLTFEENRGQCKWKWSQMASNLLLLFYLASKKVPNDFQFVWAFSTHQRNGQDESARHLSLRDNENI